jgi:hypothetical protein
MSARTKIIIGAATVIALPIAWYLISPLFRVIQVDEEFPTSTPANTLDPQKQSSFDQAMNAAKDKVMNKSEVPPARARVIAQGAFTPHSHDVKGRALLLQHGHLTTLRFEDFETVNGPDLRIYLSRDLNNRDYIDLGQMKATKGNVNYALPDDIDFARYNTVLVWCEDFSVLFSYAKLAPL